MDYSAQRSRDQDSCSMEKKRPATIDSKTNHVHNCALSTGGRVVLGIIDTAVLINGPPGKLHRVEKIRRM